MMQIKHHMVGIRDPMNVKRRKYGISDIWHLGKNQLYPNYQDKSPLAGCDCYGIALVKS